MNELLMNEYKTPIEIALGIDDEGRTTARKLYDFLEMDRSHFQRWAKKNIEDNEFYEECKDWWGFAIMANGNKCKDYKLTIDFAKHLSMESQSARGKEARDYFVVVENKARDTSLQLQNLSPELRLMISLELKQKEQTKQLLEVKSEVKEIREVVAIDSTSWREDTSKMLRKIGNQFGDKTSYQDIRSKSYELLEKRMGVNLVTRLTNKRRRMADEGICKSKRDKLNYLDIIGEDKKLIEGYVAIVKELAIKYGGQ